MQETNCSCQDCFFILRDVLIFKCLVLFLLKHCMCIRAFLLSWGYGQLSNSIIIFNDINFTVSRKYSGQYRGPESTVLAGLVCFPLWDMASIWGKNCHATDP